MNDTKRTMAGATTGRIISCLWFACIALHCSLAIAQRSPANDVRGPFYVGEPSRFQFKVNGFQQTPQPECDLGDVPDGLQVTFLGASPRVSQSIVQVNGRIARSTKVSHQFEYQIVADKPGKYRLGPFVVTQGNLKATVDAATFEFREIENDPNMVVALGLPTSSVYEGQRVRITVQWGYAGNLREVHDLSIRSEFFDKFDFEDAPVRRGDNALPIHAAGRVIELRAKYVEREINGRQFTVIVAHRTLLAGRPGTYEVTPITASIRKGGSDSRDIFDEFDSFFGRRRKRTPVVRVRAAGKRQTLTILPLPTAVRPEGFSGAVGQGFSIDVQANRTVVRVGDPIALRITIRGDGNLKQVGLPDLSAGGGLPPSRFRVPTEEIAGSFQTGQKQFNISVRVNDLSVNEIPPIAFSWFDPDQKKYVTSHSEPISMRVMPAQVVSSSDVVSNAPAVEGSTEDGLAHDDRLAGVRAASAATTADYAIETNVDRLLSGNRRFLTSHAATTTVYVLGLGILGFSLLDNRRRQVDPAILQRRRLFSNQRKRIQGAASLPTGKAAEQVADALRRIIKEATTEQRLEVESVVAQLENLIYAPGGQVAARLDAEWIRRASQLMDAVQGARR